MVSIATRCLFRHDRTIITSNFVSGRRACPRITGRRACPRITGRRACPRITVPESLGVVPVPELVVPESFGIPRNPGPVILLRSRSTQSSPVITVAKYRSPTDCLSCVRPARPDAFFRRPAVGEIRSDSLCCTCAGFCRYNPWS